jgi:hypothetical protein
MASTGILLLDMDLFIFDNSSSMFSCSVIGVTWSVVAADGGDVVLIKMGALVFLSRTSMVVVAPLLLLPLLISELLLPCDSFDAPSVHEEFLRFT